MAQIDLTDFRREFSIQSSLMTRIDLEVVLTLSAFYKPSSFVEIGIFDGRTSKNILDCSPWIERYLGVDILYEKNPDYHDFDGVRERDPISGKKIVPCPTPGIMAKDDIRYKVSLLEEPDGITSELMAPADMIFIDGDHSLQAAQRDTAAALGALRGGSGVLIWHDYPSASGVREFINKYNPSRNHQITHVKGTCVCYELVNL